MGLASIACALVGVVWSGAVAADLHPAFARQGACGDVPCGEVPGNPAPCADETCGGVDGGAGACGARACGTDGGTEGPCGGRPCDQAQIDPNPCGDAGCGDVSAGQSPNQPAATTAPEVPPAAAPPGETQGEAPDRATTTAAGGFTPGQAAPEFDIAKDTGSDGQGWIVPLVFVGLVGALVVWLTGRHRGGREAAP